jgi:hypothetical protein
MKESHNSYCKQFKGSDPNSCHEQAKCVAYSNPDPEFDGIKYLCTSQIQDLQNIFSSIRPSKKFNIINKGKYKYIKYN